MACNPCEKSFQGLQSLVVTVPKVGADIKLVLYNEGRNIVLIRRIVLCTSFPGGASNTVFLRPAPAQVSWTFSSSYLEPGMNGTFFTLTNVPATATVQAQAEYTELEGRSRSCATTVEGKS